MFELKKSGEKFHFVLKAGNGQVVLSSQMYASKIWSHERYRVCTKKL